MVGDLCLIPVWSWVIHGLVMFSNKKVILLHFYLTGTVSFYKWIVTRPSEINTLLQLCRCQNVLLRYAMVNE